MTAVQDHTTTAAAAAEPTLTLSGDPVMDRIASMRGDRVRVTWPNRCTRVGLVGTWSTRDGRTFGTFDGNIIGGEFKPATRIERMGVNGRYSTVWEV
jgi:hypothetical protein